MDTFQMEHVLARGDLVQLLLDLKIPKAYTTLSISFPQILIKGDYWKYLLEVVLHAHLKRQRKDCGGDGGSVQAPWVHVGGRGSSPLEVEKIKQEE